MATKIGSLFGDVSLRTANLDKGIAAVGKKLRKLGTSMTSLGKSMSVGLTAPIAAFGALSVKAFAEQEKSEAMLRAALQASGQEVESNMVKLRGLASEIQKVTTVGDEMSLSMMQQGISMGLNAEQADEATRGAIGLSKAFNLDLKMAMRASSAALLGQTEMLTRYIPELKDIEDPAERVALVHQKMAEGFSLAEAEAATTGGQLAQLKNAFGDLQEQVGSILAEYLTPVVDKLREMITQLQEADPAMVKLGVQIAAAVAAAGPLLIVLGQLVTLLASSWTWIVALGVGLGALLIKFEVLKEAGEAFGDAFSALMEGRILDAVGHAINGMWEFLKTFNPIAMAIDNMYRVIKPVFTWLVDVIADSVAGMGKLISGLATVAKYTPGGLVGQGVGKLADIAFRAKGGPVSSGSPYIVGEQGPELFVPNYSGSIVPNDALGGGGGQTINMVFNGVGMEIQSFIKNNRDALGRIAVQAVSENNLRTV